MKAKAPQKSAAKPASGKATSGKKTGPAVDKNGKFVARKK